MSDTSPDSLPADLTSLLMDWFQTDTWDESKAMLMANADRLLSTEALQALNELLAASTDDEEATHVLLKHRSILEAARGGSIDAAYANLFKPSLLGVALQKLPDDLRDALQAMIIVKSSSELLDQLARHPVLLTPRAAIAIEELLSELRQANQELLARAIEERYNILKQVQVVDLSINENLARLLIDWINADTWEESRDILTANADRLLSDEALETLDKLIMLETRDEKDTAYQSKRHRVQALLQHQSILKQARAESIALAYLPLLNPSPLALVLEAFPEDLREALEAMISAESSAELLEQTKLYPILLTAQAATAIGKLLDELHQTSQEDLVIIQERFNVLKSIIEKERDPLNLAFNELMRADTPDQIQQVLAQHPILLDDKALKALEGIIVRAEQTGNTVLAQRLRLCLNEVRNLRSAHKPVSDSTNRSSTITNEPIEMDVEEGGTEPNTVYGDVQQVQQPISDNATFRQAKAAWLQGDLDTALNALQRAFDEAGEEDQAALTRAIEHLIEENPNLPGKEEIRSLLVQNHLSQASKRIKTLQTMMEQNADREQILPLMEQMLEQWRNLAVPYMESVVSATPESSPGPLVLNSYGVQLLNRYSRTGNLHDLVRAIQIYEQALQKTTSGSIDRLTILNNLANAQAQLSSARGDFAALDQAILLWEQVLEQLPRSSPYRPGILSNLGNGLKSRYDRRGKLKDLDRAIQLFEEAAKQVPPDSDNETLCLSSLASGLAMRYQLDSDLRDLEQAIHIYEQALELLPHHSPDRSSCLSNLGSSLMLRYRRIKKLTDLDRAIQMFEQALEQSLPDTPNRPSYLINLGRGLVERYSTGNVADEARITAVFEEICQIGKDLALNAVLLEGAIHWGDWALKRKAWDEAVRGYTYGLEASENLFRIQLLRSSKEVWLQKTQGLYACASYALAQAGDLRRAVETFELGRARLLSQALERDRANLVQLETLASSLYEKYVTATNRLRMLEAQEVGDQGTSQEEPTSSDAEPSDSRRALREARQFVQHFERALAGLPEGNTFQEELPEIVRDLITENIDKVRELEAQGIGKEAMSPNQALTNAVRQGRIEQDKVVNAIRQIPGFEDFLTSSSFEIIESALKNSPLVYITATPTGGLALIVSSGTGKEVNRIGFQGISSSSQTTITPLWLDKLTEEELIGRIRGSNDDPSSAGYLNAYGNWRNMPSDETAKATWFATLEKLTHWLWGALMGPLVTLLIDAGIMHCTLIPQGFLGLLPLHAAWTNDEATPTGKRYALDAIAFSYAPNAFALTKAHATAASVNPKTLLAVDEPYPVKASQLHYSAREVEAVAHHFATPIILRHEEVTRSSVQTVLSHSSPPSVWHLSCHGAANFSEPLRSGLLLANDEWLTLGDLLSLHLPGVRLSVLSACETGVPGLRLLDEVISLPSGLMQAGVAGIVASLWSVNDLSTMLLLVRFYDLWLDDGLILVEALRQAQIWVRDTTNREKVDYFKGFLPEFATNKMSATVADNLYMDLMLRKDLDKRHFAHPFYWAAFGFTGV